MIFEDRGNYTEMEGVNLSKDFLPKGSMEIWVKSEIVCGIECDKVMGCNAFQLIEGEVGGKCDFYFVFTPEKPIWHPGNDSVFVNFGKILKKSQLKQQDIRFIITHSRIRLCYDVNATSYAIHDTSIKKVASLR